MYKFSDEWGLHIHEVSVPGRPYNPNLSITCAGCLDKVMAYRLELCNKYGWKVWPEECSVV